jgi:ABC-type lipoprotein export system ATPase subunit
MIISIYGPSGSGKTTLLFLLSELIKDFRGNININHKYNKGFLFQKNNLLNDLTVFENIRISQLIKNIDNTNSIIKMMENLNVNHLKDRFPNELSTGEEQRVAFIKNFLSNELIFFDEPTSSLDSKNAEELIEILRNNSINKTFIIATHDERIKKISDKIVYLEDGTIKKMGDRDE